MSRFSTHNDEVVIASQNSDRVWSVSAHRICYCSAQADWSAIAFTHIAVSLECIRASLVCSRVNLSPQHLLLSRNAVAEMAIAFPHIGIILQIITHPITTTHQ